MENFVFNDPRPSAVYGNVGMITGKFPFIEKKQFGKSVLLQPMLALFLGSGDKTLFVCAEQHANEYLGCLALLRFIYELSLAFEKNQLFFGYDPKIILAKMRFCFVPIANPDGLSLFSGELKSGSYFESAKEIASHYPSIPFPSGWKANIKGVDLNLQYPTGWDEARKIKSALGFGLPAPMNFPGTAPLSEPESIATSELVLATSPQMLIALHSQGRVIYGVPKASARPGDIVFAQKLGAASGYAVEETPLSSANAGIKDWFIQHFNRPGYTIELGIGKNPLPISQLEEVYGALAPMLMLAAAEVSGML